MYQHGNILPSAGILSNLSQYIQDPARDGKVFSIMAALLMNFSAGVDLPFPRSTYCWRWMQTISKGEHMACAKPYCGPV
jgi:hypothetical protein